jgi:DNA-binding SARP family transcriptional activator
MNDRLEIRAFGGLAVTCAGNALTTFKSHKIEALLVFLASTGRDHPRDVLAEMFWPGRSQSQAMANLPPALNNLRQHVGPYVVITRDTAGMNPTGHYWLDVADFEVRLDAVDRLQGSHAQKPLEEALDLYRGDFLEGFYVESADFEDWAALECERLRFRMIAGNRREGARQGRAESRRIAQPCPGRGCAAGVCR